MSSFPAGRLESASQNVTLRVERPFTSPQQFAQLIVGRGGDGYLARLGDVARVEQGPENPYSAFRLNGASAVGLGIVASRARTRLRSPGAPRTWSRRSGPRCPKAWR
jgi:multidrug efflux pump